MEKDKIALLTGVSMLVGGTAAEAAVLSFTDTFSLGVDHVAGSESSTDELTFDQFDGSLGTLTEVTLTLGETTLIADAFVEGQTSQEFGETVSLTSDVTASFAAPNAGESFPLQTVAQCFADPNCSTTNQAISNPLSVTSLIGAAMTPYLGSGEVLIDFDLLVTATRGEGFYSEPVAGGSWSGDFALTYTYDPVREPGPSVPEPATAGLVGLGLAGLAFARRRGA